MNKLTRVILIGAMGSGKTSIGMELARLLGFTFVDSDLSLQQQEQRSITDIFLQSGEEYFRQQESNLLIQLVKLNNIVLATGGGCILSLANRQLLQQSGCILYLKIGVAEQIHRLTATDTRPLLPSNLTQRHMYLTKTMLERSHLYASIANYTLDTQTSNIEVLAQHAYNYWQN